MPNPSAKERTQYGRSHREYVSRAAQADLNPKQRQFDPMAVLRAGSRGRIPRLLPIKYERMQKSPFAFFRGAVSIMAADFGRLATSGLHVQLCGDAHVQNLGSFAAPDGSLVFDFNDFDETIRGPWEWDVKRMAASLVLAGRESGHRRIACTAAVSAFMGAYRRSMDEFSQEPILPGARHQIHRKRLGQPIHAALRQSERARPRDLLKRLTQRDNRGELRFRDLPPDFWRIRDAPARKVLASLAEYRKLLAPERQYLFDLFRILDVGFKVVGTGSVGLRDYVLLGEGNGPRDPIFLQIKQEMPSAYAGLLPEAGYSHQGQRVAEGERAFQPMSDLLLGWTTIGEHHYLVRQLNDHKGSIDLRNLRDGGLKHLALVAGELLARGHARSGDACRISGYCGAGPKLAKAIETFALQYADQTEADYNTFMTSIKSGKIRVAASAN